MLQTKMGAYITGILLVHGYALNKKNEPDEFFTILLNESEQIRLWSSDIEEMWIIDPNSKYDYLVGKLGEKYNVDFTDKDGELKENGAILVNIKEIWNELEKEEQLETIRVMRLFPEDVVDLMNVIISQEEQIEKYHDWKIGVLDKAQAFMDLKKKSDVENPVLKPVCDLWYKELGVEKLISQIASR